MRRAIVPVNVTALRVSAADATNVTPGFLGRTAAFDKLPYGSGNKASTGDMVWRPLENADSPSPALEPGIHLHWELPEHFKRGALDPDSQAIRFPPVPTRWLVVRSLSVWGGSPGAYGPLQYASWVVESDFVSAELSADANGILRPAIAVPLTASGGTRPYMYMGRVVDAARWDPSNERPEDYLPAYSDPAGKPLYLTAIGFVGAAFSSYYPDCRSVFGFWDTFADVTAVADAIKQNHAIRFRVSYSVIGWLPSPGDDPLTTLPADVTAEYDEYVKHCAAEQVAVTTTPAEVFERITAEKVGWDFSDHAISYTLDKDHRLTSLEVPQATTCAGVLQDVVWRVDEPSVDTPFLGVPDKKKAWPADVEIALGNTTTEAVSALVKSQLPEPHDPGVLASYETLLDALQLGLLRELEPATSLVTLEQALHAKGFTQVDGGHMWTVQAAATPDTANVSAPQLTLPLTLAEELHLLNVAQQAYDGGRDRLVQIRQQLFMDWVIFVKQWVAEPPDPVIPTSALSAFLATSTGGELNAVRDEGARIGLVTYERDPHTGHIVGLSTQDGPETLAGELVAAYETVKVALAEVDSEWQLDAVPAPAYWQPTDPVLLMEGDRLEPLRRNGPTTAIAARADRELIDALELKTDSGTDRVEAKDLGSLPAPPPALPFVDAARALLGEAALLDPQYAGAIAAASGAADPGSLALAIAACQGGESPLDAASAGGLYATVRAPGYRRVENPSESVQAPVALTATFTNAGQIALAPDAVGWSAQTALPEFTAARVDPSCRCG
jgi:hypothetical protein